MKQNSNNAHFEFKVMKLI